MDTQKQIISNIEPEELMKIYYKQKGKIESCNFITKIFETYNLPNVYDDKFYEFNTFNIPLLQYSCLFIDVIINGLWYIHNNNENENELIIDSLICNPMIINVFNNFNKNEKHSILERLIDIKKNINNQINAENNEQNLSEFKEEVQVEVQEQKQEEEDANNDFELSENQKKIQQQQQQAQQAEQQQQQAQQAEQQQQQQQIQEIQENKTDDITQEYITTMSSALIQEGKLNAKDKQNVNGLSNLTPENLNLINKLYSTDELSQNVLLNGDNLELSFKFIYLAQKYNNDKYDTKKINTIFKKKYLQFKNSYAQQKWGGNHESVNNDLSTLIKQIKVINKNELISIIFHYFELRDMIKKDNKILLQNICIFVNTNKFISSKYYIENVALVSSVVDNSPRFVTIEN